MIIMNDIEVLQKIKAEGICAIIRGQTLDSLYNIVDALISGGIRIVEITFDTNNADDMIGELTKYYKDDVLVGAGTVIDSETARTAILAGAKFVLSPTLNVNVIKMCKRYSVLAVPGVTTATEALTAWENGAQLVKIFPAGVLGPNYIKQIKGPLSQIEMMAVGSVDLENFKQLINAGACAAGIGGELVSSNLVKECNFSEITRRAKLLKNYFKEIKEVM